MVAVVSGNGLGLLNSSLTQLGAAWGGQAGIGQSRESQYVNVATGNLVLQGQDDSLFGRGLVTGLVRTYNSSGSFSQTGADGWQTGYERTVQLASGTVNTANSTVQRATADGGVVTYAWDATRSAYVSTVGEGAYDTIVLSGSGATAKWLWTDGGTRQQETYNAGTLAAAGRLEVVTDLVTGASDTFSYNTSGQLATITSANGETLDFVYASTTGPLIQVNTHERDSTGALVFKSQLIYTYDSAGRLSSVQTDLTPDVSGDNNWDSTTPASNNGKRFLTTYSYVNASSLQIARIKQSDGVLVSYTYQPDGKVKTVTVGDTDTDDSDGKGQTLTFTYLAGSTNVADSTGRTWSYQYDAGGQLSHVLAPAVNGQRQTTDYYYDNAGNLLRVSQAAYAGANALLDTVYTYDQNGNRLLERDRAGNTVERTYNSANQLLTETTYTVADPDGLDPNSVGTTNLPSGALTTRYIYDTANLAQLRFVINAAGEVTENQYNSSGNAIGLASMTRRFLGASYDVSALATTAVPTLAQMVTWANANRAQTARVDFSYDAQGRLAQRTAFATVTAAGVGVADAAESLTTYVYDAHGILLQQCTLRGAARDERQLTTYAYDGMGRRLSETVTDQLGSAAATTLRTTTWAYTDSGHSLQVTLENQTDPLNANAAVAATRLLRTQVYNTAGQTISVTESSASTSTTRTARNYYDTAGQLRATQDATGARTYFFYDDAGRLTATVDAAGEVTETRYDGIGRPVQTVRYATRVDTSSWFDGSAVTESSLVFSPGAPAPVAGQAWVQTDPADRNAYRSYDSTGRLATETDAAGTITTYSYDSADRLLQTKTTDAAGTAATARITRYFYDNASRLVATLDAAGYLTETVFDAGGRIVKTIRYATATTLANRANGTLAVLRPAVDVTNDQGTRYFYDGRGNQVGMLNAEGYLTEYVYDEAANQRATKAYAKQLTGLTGSETFAALRTAAMTSPPTEPFRLSQCSYNGLGQLITEVNAEGTVTRYTYDRAGRLIKTESAQGTSDVRENNRRYDVFGNLIGELDGQGSLQLVSGLSESQLDALYAQYGTTHSYDLLGHRIESIDAQGNKAWYFYDAMGRQTFVVRGVADAGNVKNALGEVTETRYNAFGGVSDSIAYTGRITLATPGDRNSVSTMLGVLTFAPATDSRRQFSYDTRGLLNRATDAAGTVSTYTYTAFGQLDVEQRAVGTSAAVTIDHAYDNRGLETGRIDALGVSGVQRTVSQAYDAFGRVIGQIDGRGTTSNNGYTTVYTYDRLGRQLTHSQKVTVEGALRTESWASSYDAFDRVLTQTDALGKVTSYVYSDSNRSVIITTPELVTLTTVHNRFGQTVTATDALGNVTTSNYDKNGARTSIQQDGIATANISTYDVRGLLIETIDASGRTIDYTYDAVGRVLKRIEDPTGLALTTTYTYDARGNQLSVTDATGRVTTQSYDQEGRLLQVTADPTGLNLSTAYTYDALGRQFTVTDANGHVVQYSYDALGRRIGQIVDPGTGHLNLTTSYLYDGDDNVFQRTDANGAVTRFVYDEANRLTHSIDPLGGVTKNSYDPDGRLVATRQYAAAINVSDLSATAAVAVATIKARVDAIVNDAADAVSYRVYDKDGRLRFTVDGLGDVTEQRYDTANRVVQALAYVTPIVLSATDKANILNGTITIATAAAWVSAQEPGAHVQSTVYDAAGRACFSVDGLGDVTEQRFDAAGRVVETLAYVTPVALSAADKANILNGTITLASAGAWVSAQESSARTQSMAYDGAGRLLRQTDAAGAVTRNIYDAAGRTVYTIDALGNCTRNWYDQAGRLTATHRFATPFNTAALSDSTTVAQLDGLLVWRNTDQGRYFVYDAGGELRYTVDQAGGLTESSYDLAGRQVSSRSYAAYAAIDSAMNTRLFAGTAYGLLVPPTADNSVDRVSYSIYNELGQVRMTVDGAGDVALRSYDAAGRVVSEKRYAHAADITSVAASLKAGTATIAQLAALTPVDAATDQLVYHVYDAAGRLRYNINSLGQTTEMQYDAVGRLVGTHGYATTIDLAAQMALASALAAGLATPAGVGAALVADATRDTQSYSVYDAAGELRFTVDALGDVTETRYDVTGRTTQILAYTSAVAFTAGQKNALAKGTLAVATVAGLVSGQESAARMTTQVFDAVDQLRYTLTRDTTTTAVVSERRYDALGHVVAEIAYATSIAGSTVATTAAVAAAITAAGGDTAANQHLTRHVYDADGRLRFTIDDLGAVTEQRFDALGQLLETRSYASPITIGNPTEAAMTSALAGQLTPRKTTYAYDAAGRLKTVTDNLSHTEKYDYDALGQRITRTDKLNNVWTTGYDAAGRVITETSPAVEVATVSDAGAVTFKTRAIVTQTAYDGLGNVVSRSEDATGDHPRVTQYQYDAVGHQVRTLFPDAGAVNAGGVLVATSAVTDTVVTYDALGRAVVQKDVLGNYSYKVYDLQGRIAYDIDPEGYVTGYAYNALGEQTVLTRYGSKLVTTGTAFTSAGWVAGKPISLAQAQAGKVANALVDRTLTNGYDLRGNKLSVKQSAIAYYDLNGVYHSGAAAVSPETDFTYDAYGQLVRESMLIDATTNVWADTFHYFDDLGHETMTVDAEGYVTTRQYDALGQLTGQTDYARAIDNSALSTGAPPPPPIGGDASIGFDRVSLFTYDAIGRKSTESVRRSYTQANGITGQRDVVTSLSYDATDHLLTTTIEGVLNTTLTYNAVGRNVSVQEAERDVLRSDAETSLLNSTTTDLSGTAVYERASPYTEMAYDAFGNTVRQKRYANGMRDGVVTADPTRDQTSVTRYDWQGRAVMTIDGQGNKTYSNFDAADHVVHQWHAVRSSANTAATNAVVHQYLVYDKTGRQTETRVERVVGTAAAIIDRDQFAGYNAFGEIIAQGAALADLGDASKSIQTTYDAAGHLLTSNGDSGAVRTFGYNLAGFQMREQRYVSEFVSNAPKTNAEIYRQITDRLGRVVQTILPSYSSVRTQTTTVLHTLDRWGNVLQEIDPRGYRTITQYNEQNQKTRQIAPQVQVVGEDGMVTWQSPETHWMYDALGRLTATSDANGNVHQLVYNGGGQVIRSIDGTGAVTLQAYDALGNARISQNAVGYITWQAFDRNARITAHGDYLPDDIGAARAKATLERYALNEDGQRVVVTDILNDQNKYDFDGDNQLLHSQSAMGVALTEIYDLQGRKVRETDGVGGFQTWTYDVFGRLTGHIDLSGKSNTYTYDPQSGQLTNQTNQWGGNRTTAYYANGQICRIDEGGNWYTYQYDANGNKTCEETLVTDGGGAFQIQIRQRTRSTYDSNNRLVRVISEDLNVTSGAVIAVIADVKYGYDAVGNRRVVVADSSYGNGVTAPTAPNQAPVVIGIPDSRSVRAGMTTVIRLRPADVFQDPEQSALTYSATLSSGAALPTWLILSSAELASTGELVFTVDPSVTAGQSAVVRLTVTDASGATSHVDFTVNAVSDTTPVTTGAGATVLNLTTGNAFTTELPISTYFRDNDAGDVLTYSAVSISPPAAWLQVDGSTPGTLRLSGTPTGAGTYTLTLKATDGTNVSASRTITIVVAANVAPVAQPALPTQNAMIGRDFEISRPLDQLFTDANGDTLALTATLAGGAPLPAWMSLQVLTDRNPPSVRIVGQVPADLTAGTAYSIVLTARDPGGLSATQTINLNAVADPGILEQLNALPTPPNGLWPSFGNWTFTIPGNTFISSNGVALTYSASGMPSWMQFDPATQTFSIKTPAPTVNTAGTWAITVTASASGQSVSAAFTVSISNFVPLKVGDIPAQVVIPGSPFNYTVSPSLFSDSNGDALTYTATGLPPGVAFSSAGVFTGTPASGTYTITVYANDGHGGVSAGASFLLTVSAANAAPSVNQVGLNNLSNSLTTSGYGGARNFSIASYFSDPNGDTLTYVQSGKPSWLSFDPATATFSGTQSNISYLFTITVTASDGKGGSITGTFQIGNEPIDGGGVGPQHLLPSGNGGPARPGNGNANGVATQVFQINRAGGTQSIQSAPDNTRVQSLGVTAVTTATAYNQGNTADPNRDYQAAWYTYDGENRTVINHGVMTGNQITLTYAGYEQQYDAVGNAVLQITSGTDTFIRRSYYTLRGQLSTQLAPQILGTTSATPVTTRNYYDDAGRLTETRGYYGQLTIHFTNEGHSFPENASGFLESDDKYTYDADNRLLTQVTITRLPDFAWQASVANALDNGTTTKSQQINDLSVLTFAKSSVDYTGHYDNAGRVSGYSYSQAADGTNPAFTWNYTYTYEGHDSYLEKAIGGTGSGNYKATTSVSTYDAYGRRTAVTETTKIKDSPDYVLLRYFANDANSGILSRRDGQIVNNAFVQGQEGSSKLVNPEKWIDNVTWSNYSKAQREAVVSLSMDQRFVYANGQLIVQTDKAGSKLDALSELTAFSNTDTGTSSVMVEAGDDLKTIAQRVYGNESLWYVLASANAITDDSQLVAGTELKVPEVKVSKNDASTFKPYDPNQIIGPTAPSLPYIPPPKSCNPIVMIIMVVVAVVATVFTAGAAAVGMMAAANGIAASAAISAASFGSIMAAGASALVGGAAIGLSTAGAMAAAFVGGMAGSIASQVVGKALGAVDHFSLRQVVGSGIASGLTAGIGSVLGGSTAQLMQGGWSNAGEVAASAVGNAATGYVGNRIAGVKDTHFSWKSIAAGAVSNVITAGIGNGLNKYAPQIMGSMSPLGQDFTSGMIGGVVSLHSRRAFGFDDQVNYGKIAVDAFGNALANTMISAISTGLADRQNQKSLAGSPSQLGAYNAARKVASPDDAFKLVNQEDIKSMLLDRDKRNTLSSSLYGVDNFDGLSSDQQEAVLNKLATHADRLDRGSMYKEAFPNDQASGDDSGGGLDVGLVTGNPGHVDKFREYGIAASETIVKAQGALGSAVDALGEKNVRGALIVTQFALGGIPKTAISLAIDNSPVGEFIHENVDKYIRDPLSGAIGSGLFGASSDSEFQAVKPATDLSATFLVSMAGSLLGIDEDHAVGAMVDAGKRGASLIRKAKLDQAGVLREEINHGVETELQTAQKFEPSADSPYFRVLKFAKNDIDGFNRAANKALPNSRYEFGGNAWITDAQGRVAKIEGSTALPHGRYETDGEIGATKIGKMGDPGDVGFHLVGDQFGGPVNKLNVVPGNGVSEVASDGTALKNLNQSAYKVKFENKVAALAKTTGQPVPIKIETQYLPGNSSLRPDIINASYQLPSGQWVRVPFNNRAGG